MEKKMISCGRSKGVGGITFFPAKLVKSQIDKSFVWEDRKNPIIHGFPPLCKLGFSLIIPPNIPKCYMTLIIQKKNSIKTYKDL